MPQAPPRKPAGVKKSGISSGTLRCGAGVLIIAVIVGVSHVFSPSESAKTAPAEKQPTAKAVTQLTDDNFADFVATQHPGGVLIDFYTKSCQFCTKLAPEFEKAGQQLRTKGGPPLASVDQETGAVIMATFGIERFPTVLWFWKGKNVLELPRASEKPAAEIVKWALWAAQPAVQELETKAEFDEALPTLRSSLHPKARLMVHLNRVGSESMREAFEEAAQRHRSTTVFLYIKEATEQTPSSVMSYGGVDSKDEPYEGAANATEVVQWVKGTLEKAKPPKEASPDKAEDTEGSAASEAKE